MKCTTQPSQIGREEITIIVDAEAMTILVRALNHTDDVDAHDMAWTIETAGKRWLPSPTGE
jgi:hypothetical protein